jgi:hypothetical protein
VVGEVGAPVGAERLERRVGEQPPPDPVVEPAGREQQPVGRLVAEDVQQGVAPPHQQEGRHPGPPRPEHGGLRHHTERLCEGQGNREGVAGVGDATQLVADLPNRHGPHVQAVGGQDIGPSVWRRDEGGERDGGGHAAMIQALIDPIQSRNITRC